MLKVIKLALTMILCIMLVGTLGLNLFPREILSLFKATEEMNQIGTRALRIISLSFPVAGIAITISATFPPLGKPLYSLASSFTRQLIVLVPCAYLFSRAFGPGTVWYAFWVAEVISLIMVTLMFRSLYKNRIIHVPLSEQPDPAPGR